MRNKPSSHQKIGKSLPILYQKKIGSQGGINMTAKEIYKYYELMIEDVEDEEKKDELFEKLEKIDDLLRPFEKELNAELDKQDDMLPYYNPSDMANEFNQLERMC